MKLHSAVLLMLLAIACRKNTGKDIPLPGSQIPGTPPVEMGNPDANQNGSLCAAPAAPCSETLPSFPPPTGFKDVYKQIIIKTGNPTHRGRDVMVSEGKDVWIMAKFAYGIADADLKGEPIDIYLAKGCGAQWEKITTVITSKDGANNTVEGVEDSGGRVFVNLNSLNIKLPVGRHRLILNVPADDTFVEVFVEVISAKAQVIVTDIDGTLTTSEFAAATEVINIQAPVHDKAPDMLKAFHDRGYHIFYLTARPEWLNQKTREWLKDKGFPPGVLHTSNSKIGAQSEAAVKFKTAELKVLKDNTGLVPVFAFGNKPSDAKAFGDAGIDPKSSYYFKLEGDALGGVVHEDYGKLISLAEKSPQVCR